MGVPPDLEGAQAGKGAAASVPLEKEDPLIFSITSPKASRLPFQPAAPPELNLTHSSSYAPELLLRPAPWPDLTPPPLPAPTL